MRLPAVIALLFVQCGYALGQAPADLNSKGNCNANIVGSGNDVRVYCEAGSSESADSVLFVIGSSTPGGVVAGNYNRGFVNFRSSYVEVYFNDELAFSILDGSFSDGRVRLPKGEHFYTIEVQLTYLNSVWARTSCSGIIDAQASAAIVPQIVINQDSFTGEIGPVNCGFYLR